MKYFSFRCKIQLDHPVDVLQLDVPLRVGEHVRDGPPQRQAGSTSLRLDEIPDGAADDPEVV